MEGPPAKTSKNQHVF